MVAGAEEHGSSKVQREAEATLRSDQVRTSGIRPDDQTAELKESPEAACCCPAEDLEDLAISDASTVVDHRRAVDRVLSPARRPGRDRGKRQRAAGRRQS